MNLTKLKNYAPAARNALITAVTRRAGTLGIQPGRVETVTESGDVALIGGQPFPRSIVPLRKQLLDLIHRDGFDHTMEAMAYTWFNRLVALRFMELHDGYLDHGYRVLSHPQGTPLPEILQHAEHVSLKGLDREEVIRLKLDGNRDEELYRLLLLAQCAELNLILPDVFSKLDDVTILLLPDNLLHSDSVIRQLVAGSDAEDWKQVEVLGWLYQFYISEKKEAVMARKSAVSTDDIPAVTQLFTPHWIVRYLIENSLGRLWLLNRPGSRLREHMQYYIEGEAETDFLKITKPEEIKLVDPAVGSGHMLTYAFDLLILIYEEEGYAANDIPGLILKHNLHGLDLCPRAAQLAELALVFKAREKSRRFFSPDKFVRPHIIELQDVRFTDGELREYFHALREQPSAISPNLVQLLHQFEEAKTFGSLIQPCLSKKETQAASVHIQNSISKIQNSADLMVAATHHKVMRVLEQAEALSQSYHVVVANPPYLGNRRMSEPLKGWLESNYKAFKYDIFSAFIVRSKQLSIPGGQLGFMSPFVWMFISSYEEFRADILGSSAITSLVQLEYSGFDGATVPVCTFTIVNSPKPDYRGGFVRLSAFRGAENQAPRTLEAIKNPSCGWFFRSTGADFRRVPGAPIAYWISEHLRSVFEQSQPLSSIGDTRQGMATSDNGRFVRVWSEVSLSNTKFGVTTNVQSVESGVQWFPYNKGGDYRKWYGNQTFVVNWKDGGKEILAHAASLYGSATRTIKSISEYFKPCISWSKISSSDIALRSFDAGFIFDVAGCCIFFKQESERLLSLAFLNTKVAKELLKVTSPTLNFEAGQIAGLPLISLDASLLDTVSSRTSELISIATADWDNFETSWHFRDQPLLRPSLKGAALEASWRNWEAQSTAATLRMQELETENNRLFIAAYGLEGELEPDVPEEKITLFCNPASRYKKKAKKKKADDDDSSDDKEEEIEAVTAYTPEERSKFFKADTMLEFLSYAVGCMMGRYSPDHPGLIIANAGESLREFLEKVRKPLAELSFSPDEDGIIPVLDGEWFEDDIVARTKEFLRATFGEASLNENLRFIEESLGKDLLTYFLNDFYKDHLQTYKNRPIYWLFSSGKQKAFQCLVYLHRYTPGTLARIRTEYAIPLQGKIAARINRLEEEVTQTSSSAARKKLQTDLDKCKKQMVELIAFDEQLRSYADQAITLDLDDGVKTNYAKFGPLVAEAKKIYGTKDD